MWRRKLRLLAMFTNPGHRKAAALVGDAASVDAALAHLVVAKAPSSNKRGSCWQLQWVVETLPICVRQWWHGNDPNNRTQHSVQQILGSSAGPGDVMIVYV